MRSRRPLADFVTFQADLCPRPVGTGQTPRHLRSADRLESTSLTSFGKGGPFADGLSRDRKTMAKSRSGASAKESARFKAWKHKWIDERRSPGNDRGCSGDP